MSPYFISSERRICFASNNHASQKATCSWIQRHFHTSVMHMDLRVYRQRAFPRHPDWQERWQVVSRGGTTWTGNLKCRKPKKTKVWKWSLIYEIRFVFVILSPIRHHVGADSIMHRVSIRAHSLKSLMEGPVFYSIYHFLLFNSFGKSRFMSLQFYEKISKIFAHIVQIIQLYKTVKILQKTPQKCRKLTRRLSSSGSLSFFIIYTFNRTINTTFRRVTFFVIQVKWKTWQLYSYTCIMYI